MRGIRALFVLLVVGSVITAVAYSANKKSHAIEPIPAFTPADLTAEQTDNWPTARGDIYNRQFSPPMRSRRPMSRASRSRGTPAF